MKIKSLRIAGYAIVPGALAIFALFVTMMSREKSLTFFAVIAFIVLVAVAMIIFSIKFYIIFDDKTKKIETHWTFLSWKLLVREIPFNAICKLSLTKEIIYTGRSETTLYRIRIMGNDQDNFNILCEESPSYEEANKLAEEMSEILSQDLCDSTSGEEVIRKAGYLQESIAQNWKRTGEVLKTLPLPENSKINFAQNGEQIAITLPKEGWGYTNFCFDIISIGCYSIPYPIFRLFS